MFMFMFMFNVQQPALENNKKGHFTMMAKSASNVFLIYTNDRCSTIFTIGPTELQNTKRTTNALHIQQYISLECRFQC